MKKIKFKIMALGLLSSTLIAGERVFAKCGDDVETNLINCSGKSGEEALGSVICLAVSIMVTGIGVLAVLGLMVFGIQYLTSKDNEDRMRKAKNRVIQLVIGLGIYALLMPIANFLIPGGFFTCNSGGEVKKVREDSGGGRSTGGSKWGEPMENNFNNGKR